jgi:diacylglycerol kinase (ATP)
MGPTVFIIINQVAARARLVWPSIEKELRDSSVPFELYRTTHAGDATQATRAALKAGSRSIAVIGGDGTLSEAAAGFFEENNGNILSPIDDAASLAILPGGTGDDFARGLAGKRLPSEDWTARLIAYHKAGGRLDRTRRIDLIRGTGQGNGSGFICLNAITIGLGGQVADHVARQGAIMRKLSGEARFVAAAVASLVTWRERRTKISLDGGEAIECSSNLIAVTNGVYAGGGMMFSPAAEVDDGLLDVMLTCGGLTRRTILSELPRIRRGAHVSNPKVRTMKTRAISINTEGSANAMMVEADGNVRGHTPVAFHVLPGALRVVW